MKRIAYPISSLINLCFPPLCRACQCTLTEGERYVCNICRYGLAHTKFWQSESNPVSQLFWGRAEVSNACSYYFLNKGNICQQLVHQIKYHGQKDLAVELGRWFGLELAKSKLYADVDLIVPVPLHPDRQRKRGYNQSEQLAIGIASEMQLPVASNELIRNLNTSTQTQKNRVERWKNVEQAFTLRHPELFQHRHILLVDDVVTTGATIEACTMAIKECVECTISVATLAFARG